MSINNIAELVPRVLHMTLGCLVAFAMSGCKDSKTSVNSVNTVIIQDSSEVVSSQFDSLFRFSNYVIPQLTDNSILGTINKVLLSDTTIYILDDKSKITRFGFDGSFIQMYSHIGQGPGEYPSITDFDVVNGDLYILSGNKIYKYDLSNKFLGTTDIRNSATGLSVLESGFALNNGFGVANNKTKDFYSYSFHKFDGSEFNEIKFNRNLLGHEYTFMGGLNRFVDNGNDRLVYFPYNDTVYSIDENGKLSPWIIINIGNDITENMPKPEVEDMLKSNIPSSIFSVYKLGDNILFSYIKDDIRRMVLCSEDGRIAMNGCVGLDKNGFPISIFGLFSKSPSNKILNILPSSLIKVLISQKDDLEEYPILQEINSNLPDESNPILMFYEPTFPIQ